jgi:hypothetical protein
MLHESMVSALTGPISMKGIQSLAAYRIFAHCSRVPSYKKDTWRPAPRPSVLAHGRLQALSLLTGILKTGVAM